MDNSGQQTAVEGDANAVSHTPGPWVIDRDYRPGMSWNNHIVSEINPNLTICFMAHSGKPDNSECEANANLIAAAPALKRELAHLVFLLEPLERAGTLNVPGLATLNGARAALAASDLVQPPDSQQAK